MKLYRAHVHRSTADFPNTRNITKYNNSRHHSGNEMNKIKTIIINENEQF